MAVGPVYCPESDIINGMENTNVDPADFYKWEEVDEAYEAQQAAKPRFQAISFTEMLAEHEANPPIKRPWKSGPWIVDKTGGCAIGEVVCELGTGGYIDTRKKGGDSSYTVGGASDWGGFDEETALANARLVSAAPDLYEALEKLLAVVKAEAPGTALNNRKYVDLGVQCYAALAKAQGQA